MALGAATTDPVGFVADLPEHSILDEVQRVPALFTAIKAAVDRGVFGAPTFFVGDQMFWGQDRMEFVKQALESIRG